MKAAILLLLALLPADDFREFSSKSDGFAVKFPSAPKKKTQKIAGGGKQAVWSTETKDGAFQVFAQERKSNKKVDLDEIIKAVAKQFDGEVLSKNDFAVQGQKGREYELKISKPFKAYMSTRMLVAQGRFYQVQFLGKLRMSAPEVQTFLKSFKLLKN